MSYKVDCPQCGWVVRSAVKLDAPLMECPACGAEFEAIFVEEIVDPVPEEFPVENSPRPKAFYHIGPSRLPEFIGRSEDIIRDFLKIAFAPQARIPTFIALALMGVLFIYSCSYLNSTRRQGNYANLFKTTVSSLAENSDRASEVCAEHLRRWQAELRYPPVDIDDAIRRSMIAQSGTITKIEQTQMLLKVSMELLNSPPPKYIEAHAKLVSLYGTTTQYCELATSPSGNIGTYSQAVKSARDSLSKQFSELSVTMPK